MPNIYNVNNINVNNIRKEKTSLSFKVGETFSARVMSKVGDENGAKLKLLDGWQFDAELVDNLDVDDGKLLRFKVEGMEDGKLKIKVVGDLSESVDEALNIDNLLDAMDLPSDDKELAKLLMKYNIDISKENIDSTKSLITMNDKVKLDPKFIENFISKFLEGRGIDKSSPEGLNIIKELNNFFNGLKNLNKEEILFFLENNLDINEDNVDAFNDVFKKDFTLHNDIKNEAINKANSDNVSKNAIEVGIDDVKDNMSIEEKTTNIPKETKNINQEILNDKSYDTKDTNTSMLNKNGENLKSENKNITNVNNANKIQGLDGNTYDSIDIRKSIQDICGKAIPLTKEDALQVLKFVKGESTELPKELSKLPDVVKDKIIQFTKTLGENLDKEIKNLEVSIARDKHIDEKASEILKTVQTSKEENTDIRKLLPLGDKDRIDIIKSMVDKLDKDKGFQGLKGILKESLENIQKASEVKVALKEAVNNIKTSIESLITGQNNGQNLKLLNEVKMFNSLNDEYYYMDVPFNLMDQDYGCKIIIKDNRKDGKGIDSKNMKMVVTVDAPVMGKVDGYIHVLNKNMNIRLDAFEKWVEPLRKNKSKLYDSLQSIGYNINIDFKAKREEIDIVKCREYFSDDIWALDRLV